jgi:hypothetical protein
LTKEKARQKLIQRALIIIHTLRSVNEVQSKKNKIQTTPVKNIIKKTTTIFSMMPPFLKAKEAEEC